MDIEKLVEQVKLLRAATVEQMDALKTFGVEEREVLILCGVPAEQWEIF
jgi:hypothetical protein